MESPVSSILEILLGCCQEKKSVRMNLLGFGRLLPNPNSCLYPDSFLLIELDRSLLKGSSRSPRHRAVSMCQFC